MQTIRLRVNEKVYQHLMWFLKKFSKDELEIIEEGNEFAATKNILAGDLEKLAASDSELIDLEELDKSLEQTIRKHEGKDC